MAKPVVKRAYGQYCGLAQALDLVGERWTLLIVRDLLMGPKRYTDLRTGLPGVATNLLAERLERMEGLGLVQRKRLAPPTPATVYELTERGRALDGPILELGRWGGLALGPPDPDEDFRASWFALGMRATFRPKRAAGVDATYEFRIDEEVFHMRVAAGTVDARQGPAQSPTFVLESSASTFLALLGGTVSPAAALASGAARLDGSSRELARVLRAFQFPADAESGRL